jgi:hypothetical protein
MKRPHCAGENTTRTGKADMVINGGNVKGVGPTLKRRIIAHKHSLEKSCSQKRTVKKHSYDAIFTKFGIWRKTFSASQTLTGHIRRIALWFNIS